MLVFRCLGPAGSKASADTVMTWKYINPLLVLITSYMYYQKKFQTEYDINVFSGFIRHIAGYIFIIHGKIGIMNINFVYFKRIKTFKWSWMSPTTCIYKNTLETCKNPRPTSGWSELTKSCTTSTMNFHMAYFSWIPQNNAKFKLSCKFGESKCNPC